MPLFYAYVTGFRKDSVFVDSRSPLPGRNPSIPHVSRKAHDQIHLQECALQEAHLVDFPVLGRVVA